ncbi:MAG: glycoside hydrolase family 3 C-terminal domain-containing protein, partial [Phycisphaerae bacterium]
VTRLLTARVLLGEFDSPASVPYNHIGFEVVDSPAHRQLALDAAYQSMVLLKNENNFLPLQKSDMKTVAVIGPTAGFHLGGYSGSPFVRISPYAGIAAALGAKVYNIHEHIWPEELTAMSSGVQTQSSSEGGTNIGWIDNGSWVEYKPQNFTGKDRIAIRVASPGTGAVIHV